ncbi:hypothetical protein HRbin26_01937 [bacterium HR26]|nr:hypothetical protein HRbin26_01937 [bacterium HR26]
MTLGPVALFGSGETSKQGRQVHERLLSRFSPPVRIAIIETPAGFQPNAGLVAARIRDFFVQSLVNLRPEVRLVPARRRDGVYNPDSPIVTEPLLWADYLFAGPGSPTYMVKHLRGTRTLALLLERWRSGAAVAFASAAAIATGRYTLPVYEIYKAGFDLYWSDGLDLLAELGLCLAVMPHWNNAEGGRELDTSRCFMSVERFRYLRRMLPREAVILGIDEHTACIIEPDWQTALVHGAGTITIIAGDRELVVPSGERFPLGWLRNDP